MTPAMDLTRNFIKIVRTGRGITAGAAVCACTKPGGLMSGWWAGAREV